MFLFNMHVQILLTTLILAINSDSSHYTAHTHTHTHTLLTHTHTLLTHTHKYYDSTKGAYTYAS